MGMYSEYPGKDQYAMSSGFASYADLGPNFGWIIGDSNIINSEVQKDIDSLFNITLRLFILSNCLTQIINALKYRCKDKNTVPVGSPDAVKTVSNLPPWLSVLCCESKGGIVMDETTLKLTVLFEEPFWVGLFERETDGKYEVCKIVFGAEPKDYEVYDFLLKNWHKLRFSKSIEVERIAEKRINPKRMQREIKKQLKNVGIGTKAQQALKLQHEQGKLERRTHSREQREAEKERKFELRQEKRKEKHRGH